MTKPVDLIVANELHELAAKIERMPVALQTSLVDDKLMEAIARAIVCNIAHQAGLAVVLKLLEAAGVCDGLDGIAQRFQATREHRINDGSAEQPGPVTPNSDTQDKIVQGFVDVLTKALGPGVTVSAVKAERE